MSIYPIDSQAISLAANFSTLNVRELTREVMVKGLHAHNEYWQDIPFFSSIMHGVQSIEADIWAFNESFSLSKTDVETTSNSTVSFDPKFLPGELYVGHDLNYLNASWTLSNLYLDPIYDLLEDANPEVNNTDVAENFVHGIWYGDAANTLYLFLDIKKDANTTYSVVKPLLQKFIDKNYLSYYNDTAGKWEIGPLTIVLTGNLPTELVKAEETRYTSLDGKLSWFNLTATNDTLQEQAKYSVIASCNFGALFDESGMKKRPFNDTEKAILKDTFDTAHKYGLKTRIWEHVNWPIYLRDSQNTDLWTLGTDFLNIDDLSIANTF